MLSATKNQELAKRFIEFESYCFARSFVDSASEELECDEPETADSYSQDLHAFAEPHRLRSYADSDAEAIE